MKEIKYLKPNDLQQTWKLWLKEINDIPNKVYVDRIDKQEFGSLVYLYFDSVKNTKIHAKLYISDNAVKLKRPLIVLFHGHGSATYDDFNIWHSLNWVKNDFCVIMMDCRNQGKLTIDNNEYSLMDKLYTCRGLLDKDTVYDKLLYQDAVKLLKIIKDKTLDTFKDICDMDVVVAGPSQGGQLSLAAASLSDIPSLCIPDIPSGCAIISRIEGRFGKYTPYDDIIKGNPELKELIYNNVSYIDLINLAENIKCPVYTSIGTIDEICPMEFYLEAHEKIKTQKEIVYYEGYGHGGFEKIHFPKKLEFVLNYINKKGG